MAQQIARVVPHGFVEFVGANLFILANTLTAEAIRVRTDTAIVGVGNFPFGATTTDLFAVVRIATTFTFQQALQQITSTTFSFAATQAVLGQLFLHGLKQFFGDDCRHRDHYLFEIGRAHV